MKKSILNKLISFIKKATIPAQAFFILDSNILYFSNGHFIIRFPAGDLDGATILAAFRDNGKLDHNNPTFLKAAKRFFDFIPADPLIYKGTVNPEKKNYFSLLANDEIKIFISKSYLDIAEAVSRDKNITYYPIGTEKSPIYFKNSQFDGVILPVNIKEPNRTAYINQIIGGFTTMTAKETNITPAQEPEKNYQDVKTAEPAPVKVTFKDGTIKEFPAAVAAALKNDPCVDFIGEKEPEPVPEEPKTEEKPKKAKKAPEKEPEPIKIEDITPENYTEFIFALFGNDNHNTSIIMFAGFSAGVYNYTDLMNYLNNGVTPDYHTFDHWKNAGYMVKKGEKAAFTADIWKYTEKHGTMTAEEAAAINAVMIDPENGPTKEGDETTSSRYIIKKSFFFGPDQVEKVIKKAFTVPEGCELKTVDGREILTGDTKPHKEEIKSAGFYWHKKNNYWYRTA